MTFTTRSQAMKTTGLSYLGNVNTSSKIMKNLKKKNTDTYIIYLAPHTLSGYNVCPMASIDCIAACLASSGHNRIDVKGIINNARIKKTKLFFENRQFYNDWVIAEIKAHKAKSLSKGHDFSVRINGTSDINPELITQDGQNIFDIFHDVKFYDYTKVLNRSKLLIDNQNYDLTFSYSGKNWVDCLTALANNMRVAVVFEKLPVSYQGIPVINADETDLRYNDPTNVIAGLIFKKVRTKIDFTSQKFIIQATDTNCIY